MDTEADKNRIGRAIVFGFSDCSDSFFMHKEYFVQISNFSFSLGGGEYDSKGGGGKINLKT